MKRVIAWFFSLFFWSTLALAGSPAPTLAVKGRQLLVNGEPFVMKAVCYNPVVKGGTHPTGLLYLNPTDENLAAIETDFKMMKDAGINTIRTYEAILDPKVLALVDKYDLYLLVPVFGYFDTSLRHVVEVVETLKSNPHTLIWEIGNEWNYNLFYSKPVLSRDAALDLIKASASIIKTFDSSHPISTVYGEIPPKELLAALPMIDIWGLNVYSGLTFGDRFKSWAALSDKPMYFGEFGADAYNSLIKSEDQASQAKATGALIAEIQKNQSADDPKAVALGGAIYEWNDELWKDPNGKADVQDVGGIAPGGGPYPDATFNEEWWGLVDIDRNPRQAYLEMKSLWGASK